MEDMIKVKMKPLPLRILQSQRGYNMYTKVITGGKCEEDYDWYGNISADVNFLKSLVTDYKKLS